MPAEAGRPAAYEFGVFVIWSRADELRPKVLSAISERFEIRGVHRVTWSRDLLAENFARLYRTSRLVPPFHTYFERQKGGDTFTVVGVVDELPTYAKRLTRHGPADVNVRLFDLKAQLRKLSADDLVVHASDTADEANWNSCLLLGLSSAEYVARYSHPWEGEVLHIERDLIGARGWETLEDLFRALNTLVPYVVMRNFEKLPMIPPEDEHDDIDLLVGHYGDGVRVLNARPLYGSLPRWGGRFRVRVAGAPITVDIRYPGDGYFDQGWQRAVLARRQLASGGVFVPTERDHFETLAYHALVHKARLSDEYSSRLVRLARSVGTDWAAEQLRDPQMARQLLDSVVINAGRHYVQPADVTVYFNYSFLGWRWASVRRKLAGLRRRIAVRWWPAVGWARRAVVGTRQELARRVPMLRQLQRPPRLT